LAEFVLSFSTGYVQEVTKDHLWVHVGPAVRGRVGQLEASDEPDIVTRLDTHFRPGQHVQCTVTRVEPGKVYRPGERWRGGKEGLLYRLRVDVSVLMLYRGTREVGRINFAMIITIHPTSMPKSLRSLVDLYAL
jgi:hypothetical protein